jgi:(5-formylfuran-3-yl)methyl phosphate synthase
MNSLDPPAANRFVPKLLVSVRSEVEARAALAGGAAIIDVKEPTRGSLGMASYDVWGSVRKAVPPWTVFSVALGELNDWVGSQGATVPGSCWSGVDYRKIGLADAGPSWRERWRELRENLDEDLSSSTVVSRPAWVAVVYLDWEAARAPDPESIIGEAAAIRDCPGILFDTWNKSRRVEFDTRWMRRFAHAKESGRFVALAGSMDEAAIRRLRPLEPDIFAVRGAACRGGDRNAPIEAERVARLVDAAGW